MDPDQFAQVNVRMTKEFKRECDAIAEAEGLSLNEWIRRAMRNRGECVLLRGKLDECEREISSQYDKIAALEADISKHNEESFQAKKYEMECQNLHGELEKCHCIIDALNRKEAVSQELGTRNMYLEEELKRTYALLDMERHRVTQLVVEHESSAILDHYLREMITRIVEERLSGQKSDEK